MWDERVIYLSRGVECIVSIEDADLDSVRWCASGGNGTTYAQRKIMATNGKQQSIAMHRVVLERKLGRPLLPDEQTRHINGNSLDNRRANLRLRRL